jgi:hypothetical protein
VRVVAVDWSGRARGERRSIWLAEADPDGGDRGRALVRLECGRTRDEVASHLVDLSAADSDLVVGIDCSFSLPAWFLGERGYATVADLWAAAEQDGEQWLTACEPPFWGHTGKSKPELPEHFRATESAIAAVGGILPKSTFQISGAGSVGSGSIRAFPVLARLRGAGFAVWPFDEPRRPMVVEVWPRACTGRVVKSDPDARRTYVAARYPRLARGLRDATIMSEDAFDAAVTALVMAEHADALRSPAPPPDERARLEGWVWLPDPVE